MRNPWPKKNPAMSIFLSAANAWAGAFRGHATAAKRNLAASVKPAARKKSQEAPSALVKDMRYSISFRSGCD